MAGKEPKALEEFESILAEKEVYPPPRPFF